MDKLNDDYPKIMEAIESARYTHTDGMGAYMCFMAVRLLEMHRALKPTGSIDLHCDPTASHDLKAVMDAIFGWRNFRNEIIWSYRRYTAKSKRFQREHDVTCFMANAPHLQCDSPSLWRQIGKT
ncbi:MAG: DNA methyltransferase [Bacteroidetes bacterium]|nr:DNA methyltransferase [Bacteroidota bacterium]